METKPLTEKERTKLVRDKIRTLKEDFKRYASKMQTCMELLQDKENLDMVEETIERWKNSNDALRAIIR